MRCNLRVIHLVAVIAVVSLRPFTRAIFDATFVALFNTIFVSVKLHHYVMRVNYSSGDFSTIFVRFVVAISHMLRT